jgi:hypothetical protein
MEVKNDKQLNFLQMLKTSTGHMRTLIDSGADANFISKDFVERKNLAVEELEEDLKVRLADGQELDIPGQLTIIVGDGPVECFVAKLSEKADLILGFPWMKENDIQFDYQNKTVYSLKDRPIDCVNLISAKQVRKMIKKQQVLDLQVVDIRISEELKGNVVDLKGNSMDKKQIGNGVVSEQVMMIIDRFPGVFPEEPRLSKPAEDRKSLTQPAMRIDTGDHEPIKLPYY